MTKKIVTLSGDGIGPEIMAAGLEVLEKVASKIGFDYDIDAKPFGGAGIDAEVIHFLSQLWMLLNQQMLSSWLQLVDQNMTMRQFVLNKDFWPFVKS